MRNLTNYITESDAKFNNDLLNGLLMYIAGRFNSADDEGEKLISDRFGTHTDYSFDVKLTISGDDNITLDSTNIVKRSIGHIVEGAIKAILSDNISIEGYGNITLKDHESDQAGYDFELSTENFGSAKFEIKAVASKDNVSKMRNNVALTNAEKEASDYFLIVEYTLSGETVHVVSMNVFSKDLAPIKPNGYKTSHWTKQQMEQGITFIGNKYN